MNIGHIPADWRQRRTAIRVNFTADTATGTRSDEVQFLDIESLQTRETLRSELYEILAYFRLPDFDISDIRGRDRRLTRMISQWAFDQSDASGIPRFGGIRYLSRLNSDWECWAAFDRVGIDEVVRRPILANDPEYLEIARCYGLTAH